MGCRILGAKPGYCIKNGCLKELGKSGRGSKGLSDVAKKCRSLVRLEERGEGVRSEG